MLCNTHDAGREVKKDWAGQRNKADGIPEVDDTAV